MPIKDARGPVVGECNICGDLGPLTVDHSPPKGYAPAVPVRITAALGALASRVNFL